MNNLIHLIHPAPKPIPNMIISERGQNLHKLDPSDATLSWLTGKRSVHAAVFYLCDSCHREQTRVQVAHHLCQLLNVLVDNLEAVAAMEKIQRKTIAELHRLGTTPAQIRRSRKYPKTAISSVVKKEDKRGERTRRKRFFPRRDDRNHSSCCCRNEKEGKSVSASDSDKKETGTSDTSKAKVKETKNKSKTWDLRTVLEILEYFLVVWGMVTLVGTWILTSGSSTAEEASIHAAKPREIAWKGFVNDYLAHGIVEKLTLVNHKWVEFKMTNDSNQQVDNNYVHVTHLNETLY